MVEHYARAERYGLAGQPWRGQVASDSELKQFVLGGLDEAVFPSSLRMEWATFAVQMGWIPPARYREHLARGLFGLMRPPYNRETRDDVLHFAKLYPEVVGAMTLAGMPSALKQDPAVQSTVRDLLRAIDAQQLKPMDPELLRWASRF